MGRVKWRPLPKLDIDKLNREWQIDLKEYISKEMIFHTVPKSIMDYAQWLVSTGEFIIDGTVLKKKNYVEPAVDAAD